MTLTKTRQQLLTQANLRALPLLYSQDGKGEDAMAYVRYFTPDGAWTWYASEYDPTEGRFFGKVIGDITELGYWLLSEMEHTRGPLGMPIERDLHFRPTTLRECN